MKKKLVIVLCLVLVIAIAAVVVWKTTSKETPTLIMATNASFPPYEYYDDNGNIVGIDAEIAGAIAKHLGYNFQIDDMEFGSIINAVTSGKASFGLAGMTVTDERLEQVDFSDSYATGVQVVIVIEGSPITSVDDLFAEGILVGVQRDTTGDIYISDDFEANGLDPEAVQRFETGNDAVQALVTGKIDCVVIDNEPAKAYVAANGGLQILDTEYVVENYAACFKKGNDELLNQFNKALKELTEDGTIPAIIEKYIPTDVK